MNIMTDFNGLLLLNTVFLFIQSLNMSFFQSVVHIKTLYMEYLV
jgi:hypothetical protein